MDRLIGWAGILYLILLPALTARDVWQSAHRCDGRPCGILQDTALKSPKKSRPHINLGRAWFKRGQFDLALQEFQQAELVSFEEPPRTQAIAHIADFPFAEWELGKLYFNRAVARGLEGRCVQMKRDGWRAQRLDPDVSVKDLHCFRN